MAPVLSPAMARSYLSNCHHLTSSSCFRFNDALPVVRRSHCAIQLRSSSSNEGGWQQWRESLTGSLCDQAASGGRVTATGARRAGERGENWAREPGIAMWSLRYSILSYTTNRIKCWAALFHLYTMKEFLILLSLAHLVCRSGPNLMKPISIRTIPFPETETSSVHPRGSSPEPADTSSQCISIFHPDNDTLAQCLLRLATQHNINVFMLKSTHFKSLTFELFHCVPQFIEYTCRIIISNVFHCYASFCRISNGS